MGPHYEGHGKRADKSTEIPMEHPHGGPNAVNRVGSEHETKSPHGAHFEMCEPDGNHFEAAEASGHGGRGNFITHGHKR